MGMGGGKSPRGTLSEINVTPLVDVMLVLLIIFMVTAPLIQQSVRVDLPKTEAKTMEPSDAKVIVGIDAQKRIYIGEVEVPFDQLATKISANTKLQQDKEVYIHADRTLPYGVVVEVMGILQRSGIERTGLVTDPYKK